jgi:hypothetical protein
MKILKIGRRGGHTSEPAAATDTATQPRRNGRTTPRAEAARANPNWSEIDGAALVKRNRFYIHADTDQAFTPYTGAVWYRDHAKIEFAYNAPLFYAVDADGGVLLYEQYSQSWAEVVRAQVGAR